MLKKLLILPISMAIIVGTNTCHAATMDMDFTNSNNFVPFNQLVKPVEKNQTEYEKLLNKAQTAYQNKDAKSTMKLIDRAILLEPDKVTALIFKGELQRRQGKYQEAIPTFQKALEVEPDNAPALLGKGMALITAGEPDKALADINQILETRPQAYKALYLKALALYQQQKLESAQEAIQLALEYSPSFIPNHLLAGGIFFQQGEMEKAEYHILKYTASASGNLKAEKLLTLIQIKLIQKDIQQAETHLRNKDFESTLTIAESLAQKLPNSPLPLNFKGAALLEKGDHQAAQKALEAALEIQEDYVPAHLNLAKIDLLLKKDESAQRHLKKVLTNDENNMEALLILANLAGKNGQAKQEERLIKQARIHHPDAVKPKLQLINYYQKQNNIDQALDAAREAATKHPNEPTVVLALALTQLRAGNNKDAKDTLHLLIKIVPTDPQAHYLLAREQFKQNETNAARLSLQQAIKLKADYTAAQFTLARLYISEKDFKAALNLAETLKQAHPEASYSDELKGDIYMAQGKFKPASKAYALAFKKNNNPLLLKKLSLSYFNTEQFNSGVKVLQQWLVEHPNDVQARSQLAMAKHRAGLLQEATKEYLKILEYDPEHITTLNNLSILYQGENNPDAVKFAERAYKLTPERTEVVDTFAWLLVQNGRIKHGLKLLQEASKKSPDSLTIRYHLAVALEKSGRQNEASKELDQLLKPGKDFPEIDQARSLQKHLNQR